MIANFDTLGRILGNSDNCKNVKNEKRMTGDIKGICKCIHTHVHQTINTNISVVSLF